MGHAPGQHTGSESLGWWWETSRAQTKQRKSPLSTPSSLPGNEATKGATGRSFPVEGQAEPGHGAQRGSEPRVYSRALERHPSQALWSPPPAVGPHREPTGHRVASKSQSTPGVGSGVSHKPKHLPCEIHAKDNYPYSPPWLLPHLAKHIWHLSPVSTKTW